MRTSLLLIVAFAACASAARTADDAYWRETCVFGGEELRHADAITSLNFSADSQSIISTSDDGRCRIWDFQTGALRGEFLAENGIHSATLIEGGKAIVIVARNKENNVCVERWELSTRQRTWSTETPFEKSFQEEVAAGIDATEAVVIARWKGLYRLNLKTGAVSGTLNNAEIEHIKITRDGSAILARGRSWAYSLLNSNLEVQWEKKFEGGKWDFVLAPDGKTFLLFDRNSIDTCDLKTGEIRSTKKFDETKRLYGGPVYAGESSLALLSSDGLCVYDTKTWNERCTIKQFYTRLLAVTADETRAVSVTDNLICRWDLTTHKELPRTAGHPAPVYSVAVSPDGKTVASCCNRPPGMGIDESDCIRQWDAGSGREIRALPNPGSSSIAHVLYSHDGKTIYSAETTYTPDNAAKARLTAWDAATGQMKFAASVKEPEAEATTEARWLAISRDGQSIFMATLFSVFVFNAGTGAELRHFMTGAYCCCIQLMDDDKLLAVADGGYWTEGPGDVRLRLFDANTGALHCVFPPSDDRYLSIFDLCTTPDSHTLAAASRGYSFLSDPVMDERMNLLFVRTPKFQPTREVDKVRNLMLALSDDTVDVRDQSSAALKAFGPEARQLAEEALKTAGPETRARLKEVLAAYTRMELPRGAGGASAGDNAYAYSIDIDSSGKRFVAAADGDTDSYMYLLTGELSVDGNNVTTKITHRQRAIRRPQRVRFLPDGEGIVTGNFDGTLSLFRCDP